MVPNHPDFMRRQIIITFFLIVIAFYSGNISAFYQYRSIKAQKETLRQNTQPKEEKKPEEEPPFSFWEEANKSEDQLKTFWKVWDIVDEDFFDKDKTDDENRIYGATKGMVSALGDPYTVYMTPKETKEFEQSLDGKLEGIGAELTVENGNLVVITPIKGSPAEKAGLKPGDIVYKIDENITSDLTLFDAIMKIRGPKGTKVKLTLIRKKAPEPIEVSIIRDSINIPSTELAFKEDIAVITVNQFNDSTTTEMNKIIGEILIKKPKGIIIDLRNNGGGYLDTSVTFLSEFIEGKKTAVIIKQRDESKNEVLKTSGKARLKNFPLVVLINEGSASASEIVAGAIQDYKSGLLIGEKSHGKGSIQQIDDLEDGSSLRITIAKWFTPLDRSIDKAGILPDRVVKITDEDIKDKKDPQMDEAVNYLEELAVSF